MEYRVYAAVREVYFLSLHQWHLEMDLHVALPVV